MQFGTVIAYPLSGFLCQVPLDNGWPLAFYVPGIAGIAWFVAWIYLVSDGPDVHPGIDENEKQFIMSSSGSCSHKKSVSTPHDWSSQDSLITLITADSRYSLAIHARVHPSLGYRGSSRRSGLGFLHAAHRTTDLHEDRAPFQFEICKLGQFSANQLPIE
jgi:MFS family permease